MDNKDKDLMYTGELLIQTIRKESGLEKHVYIKNSFLKDGMLYMDTKGAELAIQYDLDKIDNFIKSGLISTEDGKKLKDDILTLERQMKTWQEWKSLNPTITEEEESKAFQEITGSTTFGEVKQKKTLELNLAIRKLIAQKDSIEPGVIESLPKLFKSINSSDCFHITKPIMDRIYYISELLNNAVAEHISGDQWEIRSKVDIRVAGPIGLSHTFRAVNASDAKKYLDDYRDWIRGEGLKVFTAYWKMACERGYFKFSTPLSEVMQQISEENRNTYFSVKEKQNFWAATRRLENTKLTIELHFPTSERRKKQKLVIEHRLVDVGARTHDADEDTYPNDIMVKVLDPTDFQQQSQIGTAIHNNTLKLRPREVLLALCLQVRGTQTRETKDENTWDEEFMFDRANLKKTAESNRSKARKDLTKKLEKLEESHIIEGSISSGTKRKKSYTIKARSKKSS